VVARVPLGGRVDDIVAAPHGEHVYVVVGDRVKVINRAHHIVTSYPTGRHPRSLLLSADGARIHVTGYDGATAVIDTDTASVKMLELQRSNAETVSPDGSHLYQLHSGTVGDGGSAVSVISAGGAAVAVVPVDKHAIRPDGARLFVASRPSPSFQDWRGSISVIDTATHKVVDKIAVELAPDTLEVSRDGTRLYATHYHKNSFSIVDLGRGGVVRWTLSDAPTAVTVTHDGATAFITNLQSLIAIDTRASRVKRMSVGALPRATHSARTATVPTCWTWCGG
jgi:YVTN family beta-propeller protein